MGQLVYATILGALVLPLSLSIASVFADDSPLSVNGKISNMKNSQILFVIDPPANFKVDAAKLGYRIGSVFELKELALKAIKVIVPAGYSIDAAISELEKHFPDIMVGENEV